MSSPPSKAPHPIGTVAEQMYTALNKLRAILITAINYGGVEIRLNSINADEEKRAGNKIDFRFVRSATHIERNLTRATTTTVIYFFQAI